MFSSSTSSSSSDSDSEVEETQLPEVEEGEIAESSPNKAAPRRRKRFLEQVVETPRSQKKIKTESGDEKKPDATSTNFELILKIRKKNCTVKPDFETTD